ncbi:hypothetical protein MGYG_00864 [Nannizzia gypsea CBS 118893]|uniref:Involucrin repeat protein n=1 Tax=Arthroderma gypseum (strain ATCC MYA-4604 / CBS 118893) TaxID=535722 RepID=E5R2F2_ARTGP|nr:hypothetical protein MGYG_00864 [Nannizzia gypsea CBS 118893]EFQ97828.1 hypothetical protein MGYG_00864 [Nannizzia gypsea CBS 118893]
MFRSLLGTQSSSRSSVSSRHRHRRDRDDYDDDDDDSRSKYSSRSHHKSSRHHSSSSKHKSSRSDDRDADRHSSSRRSSRRYEDDGDGARSTIAPSEITSEAPSRMLDGERSTFGDDPNDHYKERRSRRRGRGDDDSVLERDPRDARRRERDTYTEEPRYRDDAPSTVGPDFRDASRRERDGYGYSGEPRRRSRDRYNDNDDDRRQRSSRPYDEPATDDRYEPATRSERRSRALDDRAIPEDQRPIEPAGRSRTAASGPGSSRSPMYPSDGSYPTTSGPGAMPQSSYSYPPPTSGSYPPPDSAQQPPMMGSAAEYYGDQGQSVPTQPGFTPSAISPSGPEHEPHPSIPIPQFDQHQVGPSGPPPQHDTGTGVLDGMAAGAAGYGISSAMSGGLPHSGPPNTSPIMPGSMSADVPSNSLPNAPSNTLPDSFHESPVNYAPSGYPENQPQHHSSSSHGGLAALGATAGLAAAAGLAAHSHHNSHHNSYSNSHQVPQSQYQQPQHIGGFQQGNLAYQKRQQGPLKKFVDFWRDPEGVGLYEEYSEIIGTCRYCFEPGTTSRDAPRKHRYRRRLSNDSFGGRSRVDKLTRYGSSEEEGHHKSSNRKSWLAAGLAAYVGKSIFDKRKRDHRDRSPSIRRTKSSSSSSVGGKGAVSYGQATISEYSHPPSTIGGGRKLDRYDSRSDVSKPSISAHSRSKSEGYRRRDRSRSSSSDSKSGRSGLKTAAIAAGALGTAAALSSASHGRKERRIRARSRSRSPRKPRRRYSSSSSSSMIDISRPSAKKGLASFSNFFSAPSERSRTGRTGRASPRKKQRNLFGIGSTYSSSDDADLAFGSGFLKPRNSKKGKNRKRDEVIDAKLIGLGAAAAGLAASASIANGRRNHSLIAVKERKSKHETTADDNWESVSDESSSADSGLAYGGPSSNSRDSFTSDSGTSKWRWRWGTSKKKKKTPQSLEYPNKRNDHGRNSQASLVPPSSSLGSLPSMQNVDPIPTGEQSLTPYRHEHNSTTGGPSVFDTTKQIYISRPEHTEIDQPKPTVPVSNSFYNQKDPQSEKPKPTFKEIAPAVASAVAGAALMGTAIEYYNDHPLKDSKAVVPADPSKSKDMSLPGALSGSNRERPSSHSDLALEQHQQKQIMPPPPASLPGSYDLVPRVDNVGVDRSRKARDDSDISMKKVERRRRNSSPALEDQYTYITPSDLSKRRSTGKGVVQFELTKEQQDKEMRQRELESEKAARRYPRDDEPVSDPENRIPKSRRSHPVDMSPQLPDDKFEAPPNEKEAESWSLPSRVAFPVLSGAAAVAADRILDEKKRKREERRRERRGYSESEAGSSMVSRQRFDSPDRHFVEEPGELAEKPVPNPKTKPTYENYATYFTPPELRRESSAESVPEVTSAAKSEATKFRLIEPRTSPLDTKLTRAEPTRSTSLPWPVPDLNLIEPTPPQSRTGSILSHGDETKDRQIADPIVTVPGQAAFELDKDDTHDIARNTEAGDIEVPGPSLHNVPGAAKKLNNDDDIEVIPSKSEPRELQPGPEIPSPHHMPGEFDDIDFAATLAAGAAMSGFDPSIVTDNPTYHSRVSPPRSEGDFKSIYEETPVSPVREFYEHEPLPPANRHARQEVTEYHGPTDRAVELHSEVGQDTLPKNMEIVPPEESISPLAPEATAAKLSKKEKRKKKAAQKKSKSVGEQDLEPDWEEQPIFTQPEPTEADREVNSGNADRSGTTSRDLFEADDKPGYGDPSFKEMVDEGEKAPGHEKETWQDAEEGIQPYIPLADDSSIKIKPAEVSPPTRDVDDQLLDNQPYASMPGDFGDVWVDLGPVGGNGVPIVPEEKGPVEEPEFATVEKPKKKSKGKSKLENVDGPSLIPSDVAEAPTRGSEADETLDWNVEPTTTTSIPDLGGLERGKSKSKRRSKRYAELIDSRSEVGESSKPEDDNISVVSRAKSEAAKDYAKNSDKSRGFFGLFGSSPAVGEESSKLERDSSPPPSEISTSSKKKKKSKKDRRADEDAITADDNDLPASRDIEPVNAYDANNDDQQRQKSKDRKKGRKNRYEQIVESGKASDDEDKNRQDTSRQEKDDTLVKDQSSKPFLDDSFEITSVPSGTLEQDPATSVERESNRGSAPVSDFPIQLNLPSRGRSRSVTPLPGEKVVDLPTQSLSRPSSRSRSPPGTAKRISWRGGFNFGDVNSSPTAIPIQLRRPPSTPDRGTHDSPVSPSRPKSGHKRPKSTEFKTNREFRPLWLVERHTSKTEQPEEETYPSLPSSKSTSRMSSVEDLRAKALEGEESMDIFSTPRRRPSLHVATNDSSFDVDVLGSQQATPTAHSFRSQDRRPKEKPKYEFHSPSELLEGPMSSRSALNDVTQPSEGTIIPGSNKTKELELMDLQNLPPLPDSPIHEEFKSRELDVTPGIGHDVPPSSHHEPEVEVAEIPAETISPEHLPPLPDSRSPTPTADQGVETQSLAEGIDRSLTPRPTYHGLDEAPVQAPVEVSTPDSDPATLTQLSPTYRTSEASEYESVDEDHFVDASSQAPMSPSYQEGFNSPTTPTCLPADSEPQGSAALPPFAADFPVLGVPDEEDSISKDTDAESVTTVKKDDGNEREPEPTTETVKGPELESSAEIAKEPEDEPEVTAPRSKKNKKKNKKNHDAEPTPTSQTLEPEARLTAEPDFESVAEPVAEGPTEREAPLVISTDSISTAAADQELGEGPTLSTAIGEESKLELVEEDPVPAPVTKSKSKKGKNKKGRKNKVVVDSVEKPSQEPDGSSAGTSTRKDGIAIAQDEGLETPTRDVAHARLGDAVTDFVSDMDPQLHNDSPDIVNATPPKDTAVETKKATEDPVPGEVLAADVPLPVADVEEADALNSVRGEPEPAETISAQEDCHPSDKTVSLPHSPVQQPHDIPLPPPDVEEADILQGTDEVNPKEPEPVQPEEILDAAGPSLPYDSPVTEVAAPLPGTDTQEIEEVRSKGWLETSSGPEPSAENIGVPVSGDSLDPMLPMHTDTQSQDQPPHRLEDDILPTRSSANEVDESGDQSGPDMFFDVVRDADAPAKLEMPDELADKEPVTNTPADKPDEFAELELKPKKKKGKKGKKDHKDSTSIDNETSASAEQPPAESSGLPVKSNDMEEAPTVAQNEETVEQPATEERSCPAEETQALSLSTNLDANAAEPSAVANDAPPHIPADNSSQEVRSTSKQSKKQKKKDKKKQALPDSAPEETVPEASNVEKDVEKSTLAVQDPQDQTAATEEIGQDQLVNTGESDIPIATPGLVEGLKDHLIDDPVDEVEAPKEDTLPPGFKLEAPVSLDVDDKSAVEKDSEIKDVEGSEAMRFIPPAEEPELQAETIPSTEEAPIKPAKSKKDKKGKKGKKNRDAVPLEDEAQSAQLIKSSDEQPLKESEIESVVKEGPLAKENPVEPASGLPIGADDTPVETSVEKPITDKEKKKRKKNRSVSAVEEESQSVQKSFVPDVCEAVPEIGPETQEPAPQEIQDDSRNTEASELLVEAPSVVDKLPAEPELAEPSNAEVPVVGSIPMETQASEQVVEQPSGVDDLTMRHQHLEPLDEPASEINDTFEEPQAPEPTRDDNLQGAEPQPLELSNEQQALPIDSIPVDSQPLVEEPSEIVKEPLESADDPGVLELPVEKPGDSEEPPKEPSDEKPLPVKGKKKKKKKKNQPQSLDEEPQAVESSSQPQELPIVTEQDEPPELKEDIPAEHKDNESPENLWDKADVQQDVQAGSLADQPLPVENASVEALVDTPLPTKEKRKKKKKNGHSISIDEERQVTGIPASVNDLSAKPLEDAPTETPRDVEPQENLSKDEQPHMQEEEFTTPQDGSRQDTEPSAPTEEPPTETLPDAPSEPQPYKVVVPVEADLVSGSPKTLEGETFDTMEEKQPESQQAGGSFSNEAEPTAVLEETRPEVTETMKDEQRISIPSEILEPDVKDLIEEEQPGSQQAGDLSSIGAEPSTVSENKEPEVTETMEDEQRISIPSEILEPDVKDPVKEKQPESQQAGDSYSIGAEPSTVSEDKEPEVTESMEDEQQKFVPSESLGPGLKVPMEVNNPESQHIEDSPSMEVEPISVLEGKQHEATGIMEEEQLKSTPSENIDPELKEIEQPESQHIGDSPSMEVETTTVLDDKQPEVAGTVDEQQLKSNPPEILEPMPKDSWEEKQPEPRLSEPQEPMPTESTGEKQLSTQHDNVQGEQYNAPVAPVEEQTQSRIENSAPPKAESVKPEDDGDLKPQSDRPVEDSKGEVAELPEQKATDVSDKFPMGPPTEVTSAPKDKKKKKKSQPKALEEEPEDADTPTPIDGLPADSIDHPVLETAIEKPLTAKEKKKLKKQQKKLSLEQEPQPAISPEAPETLPVEAAREADLEVDTNSSNLVEAPVELSSLHKGAQKSQETPHLEEQPEPKEVEQSSENITVEPPVEKALPISASVTENSPDKPLSAKERKKKKKKEKAAASLEDDLETKEESVPIENALDETFGTEPLPEEQTPTEKPLSVKEKKKKKKKGKEDQEDQLPGAESLAQPEKAPEASESMPVDFLARETQSIDNTPAEAPFERPLPAKEKKKGKKGKKSKQSVDWTDEAPQPSEDTKALGEHQTEAPIQVEPTALAETALPADHPQAKIEDEPEGPTDKPTNTASIKQGTLDTDIERTDATITEPQGDGGEDKTGNPDEDGKEFQLSKSKKKSKSKKTGEVSCWTDEIPPTQVDNGPAIPPTELESQQRSLPFDEGTPQKSFTTADATDTLRNDPSDNLPASDADQAVSEPKPTDTLVHANARPEDDIAIVEGSMQTVVNHDSSPEIASLPKSVEEATEERPAAETTQEGTKASTEVQSTGPGQSLDDQMIEKIQENATENPADESLPDKSKGLSSTGLGDTLAEPSIPELQDPPTPTPPLASLPSRSYAEGKPKDFAETRELMDKASPNPIQQQEIWALENEASIPELGPIDSTSSDQARGHQLPELPEAETSDAMQETPAELLKSEPSLPPGFAEKSLAGGHNSAATTLDRHALEDVSPSIVPELAIVHDEISAQNSNKTSKKEKRKKKKKGVVSEEESAVAPEVPVIKMETLPDEPSISEPRSANLEEEPPRILSKKEQKAAKKKARKSATDEVDTDVKEVVRESSLTPDAPENAAEIVGTADFNELVDAPMTEEAAEVGIQQRSGLEGPPASTPTTVDTAEKDAPPLSMPSSQEDSMAVPEIPVAMTEISNEQTLDEESASRELLKKQNKRAKAMITSQTEVDVPNDPKEAEPRMELEKEQSAPEPASSNQSSKKNKKKKKKNNQDLGGDAEALLSKEKEANKTHTVEAPVYLDVDTPVAGEVATPKEDDVNEDEVNNEREMDTASLDLQLSGDHEVIDDTPEIQHPVLPDSMTPDIGDFSEDTAPKADDVPEENLVEMTLEETGQLPKAENPSEFQDIKSTEPTVNRVDFEGAPKEVRAPGQDVPFGSGVDAKITSRSHEISEPIAGSAMEIDSSFTEASQLTATENAAAVDDGIKDVPMKDLDVQPSAEQTATSFHDPKDLTTPLPQETRHTEPILDAEDIAEGIKPSSLPTDEGETAMPANIPIGSLQDEETWLSKDVKGKNGKKGKKNPKGKDKALEEYQPETETPLFKTEDLPDLSSGMSQIIESAESVPNLTARQLEDVAVPTRGEKGKRPKAKGLVVDEVERTEPEEEESHDQSVVQHDPWGNFEPLPESVSGPSTEPPGEGESVPSGTGRKGNKAKDKKKKKSMAVENVEPKDIPRRGPVVEPEVPAETSKETLEAPRERIPEAEVEFLPNVTKRKGKKSKVKGKDPAIVKSVVETEESLPGAARGFPNEPDELDKPEEPAFLSPRVPWSGSEGNLPSLMTGRGSRKNRKMSKVHVPENPALDIAEAQLLTPEPEPIPKPAAIEPTEIPDWSQKFESSLRGDKPTQQDTRPFELTTSRALDIDVPGRGPSGSEPELTNQPPENVQLLDRSMDESEAMTLTPKRISNDDPFSVESSSKERSSTVLFHSSPSTRDFSYMTPSTQTIYDQPEERPSTPTPTHLHKSIETDKPLDAAGDITPHALLSTPEQESAKPIVAEDTTSKSPQQTRPSLEPPSLFGGPYGLAERGRSVSRSVSPPKTPLGTIEEHSAISAPYESQPPPAFPQLTPDAVTTSRGPEKMQQAQPPAWTTPDANPVGTPESTPPKLRRVKSRRSSDLKAASQRDLRRGRTRTPSPSLSQDDQEYQEDEEARQLPSSSTYDPVTDKGKAPLRGMAADVYEGWGDVQGAPPLSPTRPPSVRRRRSLQRLQELETRLDQLVSENRLLGSSKAAAEKAIESQAVAQRQHARALEARDQAIQNKELEIQQLQKSSDWLKKEITRLTEVNEGLAAANAGYAASRGLDGGDKSNYKEEWEKSQRELEKVRAQYAQLSSGLEQMVKHEVGTALADKDAEIQLLRDNLADAQDKIKELQAQIQAAVKDDILIFHDEDYFDNACQKLCQHVQQWVLRFSKFSDMRVCRTTSVLRDEKIVDRFENAILDGTDVDTYLSDRVRRRDVFMSVAMTMMWEYIFTRYLFGMDREQRQKLKTLEKHLSEVGPPNAVHKWRATTLTLLSKRPSFKELRSQDTEAVVQEIYRTLSKLLPPPHELEKTVLDSLRNVMRSAVDLSIKMRTQRAEYIMLPPLQPEYDTNGELLRKVYFNAALMNERSGETTSNEELEAQRAVVRMVLFPLVVKKGSDEGDGDEEIVVCPAQVLVARPPKERKSSKGLSADRQSIRSTQSFPSISMAPSNPSNIM